MNDLERALLELDVEWPATPDLATAVMTRIARSRASRAGEARSRAARAPRAVAAPPALSAGWRARAAYVAAALVILAGGTLAVSPEARSTVLRWLGLGSVEIRREPLNPGVGRNLNLGDSDRPPARHAGAAASSARRTRSYETRLPDGTHACRRSSTAGRRRCSCRRSARRVTPFIEKTVGSADAVERLTHRRRAGVLDHGLPRVRVPGPERGRLRGTAARRTACCWSSAAGACTGSRGRSAATARSSCTAQLSEGSGGIVASSA